MATCASSSIVWRRRERRRRTIGKEKGGAARAAGPRGSLAARSDQGVGPGEAVSAPALAESRQEAGTGAESRGRSGRACAASNRGPGFRCSGGDRDARAAAGSGAVRRGLGGPRRRSGACGGGAQPRGTGAILLRWRAGGPVVRIVVRPHLGRRREGRQGAGRRAAWFRLPDG